MTLLQLALVILGILLPQISAVAAVGTITTQQHDPATIERASTKLTGTKGTGVEMSDALRTTQGRLGITFVDKTTVQMTENSKLIIDEFVYDPNQKDAGKLAIKIASGTARYASGQIAKNDPAKVKIATPTATVSVRGTDFTATVDELGGSTIILLPSCPVGYRRIEECITGAIDVETAAGLVSLTQPFQATVVSSSESAPLKPLTLSLTEDQISNILILSPPRELKKEEELKSDPRNVLDINPLETEQLTNKLDDEQTQIYSNRLDENLLDTNFLQNILDIINLQMRERDGRILSREQKNKILPDYIPGQNVKAYVDSINVELCMESASDVSCIRTPTTQSSTINQIQGPVEIVNRVNDEGTTTITTRQ